MVHIDELMLYPPLSYEGEGVQLRFHDQARCQRGANGKGPSPKEFWSQAASRGGAAVPEHGWSAPAGAGCEAGGGGCGQPVQAWAEAEAPEVLAR